MVRQLTNIEAFINGNPDGYVTDAFFMYSVVDGNAFRDNIVYNVPDGYLSAVVHDTGSAGEFWTDVISDIKFNEGI